MPDYKFQTEGKSQSTVNQMMSNLNQNFKEQDVIKKAQNLGLNYINLIGLNINSDLTSLITLEESTKWKIIPFFLIGKKIRLGLVDPENIFTQNIVQKLKDQGYKVNLNLCSLESLQEWQKIYQSQKKKSVETDLLLKENDIKEYDVEISDLSNYATKLEELKSDELLNLLNLSAIKTNTSDIHIQPEENSALLRFRIDGVLKTIFQMPSKVFDGLIKQIKYESHLKLNINRTPQDGQFNFKLNNTKIDVRVSTLPTEFGETIVMRYLNPMRWIVSLEKLGIEGRNYEIIQKVLSIPNGMILVTGPTGSGKTTTLYSILNQINSNEKKIITLEDPIEYHLSGISQSQVQEELGYTFALWLRSILRQDPDIVMVGEIRDQETAETATQAALTGHLVLSTLHTNSAIETIPRLINMGLKSFVLAPALNVVLAQRLVRRLCEFCAIEQKPSESEKTFLLKIIENLRKRGVSLPPNSEKIKYPQGCPKCSKTWFNGQIALIEVLYISENIKNMILKNESSYNILQKALEEGMITMEEDGILKVLQGITTLSEITRVT